MHAPDRGVVSLSSSTPNLPSALPPQNPPRKQDLDVAADEAIEICTSKEIPDNVMEVRRSPHILWPTRDHAPPTPNPLHTSSLSLPLFGETAQFDLSSQLPGKLTPALIPTPWKINARSHPNSLEN